LARTRFTTGFGNEDWSYGFDSRYLRELVRYWLETYDWRAQERAMNAFDHYRVVLDDVPIHFIHERGVGPDPIPIVLTHGWPWTFWDFRDVIGPLTDPGSHGGDPADAFDVIVPSLPGYAFSSPLRTTGVNFWRIADLWNTLMTEVLAYERFAAWGADWGGFVTGQLGHKYPDTVLGVPSRPLDLFNVERPWADIVRLPLPDDPDVRREILRWEADHVTHVAVQAVEPETLAAGLNDSPAGLAAWLIERRRSWSACDFDVESLFSKDDLITTVMLYWVTETIASSMRMYVEAVRHPWTPSRTDGPTSPRRGLAMGSLTAAPPRGHFGPAEHPEPVIDAIRSTYGPLRSG
jgi:pimeloyl-ACP methyl ester carboxylesterase